MARWTTTTYKSMSAVKTKSYSLFANLARIKAILIREWILLNISVTLVLEIKDECETCPGPEMEYESTFLAIADMI